jgi:hypothetical protein
MLYQLSHVRVPVRGNLGPVRRISPALRQNFIRSSRNHQLEAGIGGKNLSLECRPATLLPALAQVTWRVAGTNRPFGMIIRGTGADARLQRRPSRRRPSRRGPPRRGPSRRGPPRDKPGDDKPGDDRSPRRRLRRIGRGAPIARRRCRGLESGGLSRPVTGARAGKRCALPRCHCALRISSVSSVSTSTKSVSSPPGTIA